MKSTDYAYVSVINDTTNILITTKDKAMFLLHTNDVKSFIVKVYPSHIEQTRGISFDEVLKEWSEIYDELYGGTK